jgi:hypothetical protein
MKRVVNEKCRACSICSEVTHTITGAPIEPTYHQCLADMEGECLGGVPMNTKEFEYWNNTEIGVKHFRKVLLGAKAELEDKLENAGVYDELEAIVCIYVNDSAGQYAMREFTCMVTDITEEDYDVKYDREGRTKYEEEVWDFDKLIEEVNEELEEYLKETGLDKEIVGFSVAVQWWDGHIVSMMYPQS